jgi:dTDP-4-dehydrorhamnose 3,5-epimerase
MNFLDKSIHDVVLKPLHFRNDSRGWLIELFRNDEIDVQPVMAYVSLTLPGVTRGPHEHVNQTDYFAFISSLFEVHLWDLRKESPTYGNRMIFCTGKTMPLAVIVPPGVVHGYKCIGHYEGLVFNAPNSLFMGENRAEPVDEIRHENDPNSPCQIP